MSAPAETLVRAVADVAAVATLGLAVVPALDTGRYRDELLDRAAGPLAVAAAGWVLAELARLVVSAGAAAGQRLSRLGVPTTVDFALDTAAGRAVLVGVAAAVVCLALAVARRPALRVPAAGAAAVGLAARPLTGHLSDSPLGGAAAAVHTLAAALWCGVLFGLVMTVRQRGQWARVLPRFSEMSLLCVAVLLVTGVLSAAVTLDSAAALYTTAYGRLLSAKVAMTVVLVALGWRNRTLWLPAARSHRATAALSRTRSRTELGLMAVVLVLAAALAVTG